MIYLAVRLVGGAAMFVWNEQSAISSQQLAFGQSGFMQVRKISKG
jgi:hypothetical protein